MRKSDLPRLRHILDAAEEALSFTASRSRRDLDIDRQLALSLVQLLQIIGEAARAVSSDFRTTHPEIPWKKMAGMRDFLIHRYFDVNLTTVWETVTEELPPLIKELKKVIPVQ